MGALCAGPNKNSAILDTSSIKLQREEQPLCDFKPTETRQIYEITSEELFEQNMGRFNKKWSKAANGQGLIDASCFKDLFYIVKKHSHLSILSEL